jgi:hypothetical protein
VDVEALAPVVVLVDAAEPVDVAPASMSPGVDGPPDPSFEAPRPTTAAIATTAEIHRGKRATGMRPRERMGVGPLVVEGRREPSQIEDEGLLSRSLLH